MKVTFKNIVVGFPRRFSRHFRRLTLWETLPRSTGAREASPVDEHALFSVAREAPEALLTRLESSLHGLSSAQVAAVRAHFGLNLVESEKNLSWWRHLWISYQNPFNILLTVLAGVSCIADDTDAAIIITAMVALSTLLRFQQESKANKAADSLKAMVSTTATVIRCADAAKCTTEQEESDAAILAAEAEAAVGTHREVPIADLVPGDLIVLRAGDMIPADCRLLSAKDLFLAQSAMTGESLPVEKFAETLDAPAPTGKHREKLTLPELRNILLMGTNVISGSAIAVVTATGKHTYFGTLAARITETDREPTAFQTGVNKVSGLLIRFMLVMAPLVFVINGVTKGDWTQALLFALSIAVGLTPEMLPMIVTSTLAKGAVFLSRKKVIVKRLDAVQNLGAMNVLCTDKTGTLTRDTIELSRHTDIWGEDSDDVMSMVYLNSFHQTGLKSPLDDAVIQHAGEDRKRDLHRRFRKVDEIPFDFVRRRMSVVVENEGGQHLVITKGAVEEVSDVCVSVRHGDQLEPLTPELRDRVRQVATDLNREGLRVVAVASKEVSLSQAAYGMTDECALTLLGYIALRDPPRESAAPTLKALAEHGIAVKVLTGDNALVTAKICHDVGLEGAAAVMLTGADIEDMDDEALADAVEAAGVFTRLTPLHKDRIVRQLRQNGHIVGFIGDGINDAPALRAADIGISVDSGVDIAKEAADIILLEKSLAVLEEGVREGRRTFANMLKYINMTASSNFGNVLSVLVAGAVLPFLPMLPLHLLTQNLLYDISQVAIPFDRVDEEDLMRPQHWNPAGIKRFMFFFGPVSSLFDLITFGVMWYVFKANNVAEQTLFQSGWFMVGLITQTLIVHMIRTAKIPFIQSRAAWPLIGMTVSVVAFGIFLPMGPLAPYFKLEAVPISYFGFLTVIAFAYMTLAQVVKGWYYRVL